jgi:gamma-glutamyltranspeptidase/glutathione hydrolase
MLLNGRAPRPGEVIRLPNLAKTFKELVERGKDGFYKGRVAQAIVDLIQSKGGVMELEDLTAHTSTFVEPIKYTYAGEVTVYEVSASTTVEPLFSQTDGIVQCPPNGQGITALIALGILEQMQEQGLIPSLLELPHNSLAYLHALIEALRYVATGSEWHRY